MLPKGWCYLKDVVARIMLPHGGCCRKDDVVSRMLPQGLSLLPKGIGLVTRVIHSPIDTHKKKVRRFSIILTCDDCPMPKLVPKRNKYSPRKS